mmetsp:Transcript_32070/g.63578  ORF Transcript_32070/g.63578 Transcript_32070/m.63578 type:complete len:364 (-) Transcript_32070:16-1107(-)
MGGASVCAGSSVLDRMLFYIRVFARTSPANKVEVVEVFKEAGLMTGMCGDGGNDCGALKAAHVGVAVSQAEASVVAPFAAGNRSVMSVVLLLQYGRCALHVSFSAVKFLLFCGLIASVTQLTCRYFGVFIAQLSYFMIDIVAVLVLGFALSLGEPADRLAPSRPKSSLLGALNISSLLGVFVISFAFYVAGILHMQTWEGYVRWPAQFAEAAQFWFHTDNWESTSIYTLMYLMQVFSALVFSFGHVHRAPLLNQYPLLFCFVLIYGFSLCVLFDKPDGPLAFAFHVASEQFNGPNPENPVWKKYQENGGAQSPAMDVGLRVQLVLICLASHVCVVLFQKIGIEGQVGDIVRRRYPSERVKFRV